MSLSATIKSNSHLKSLFPRGNISYLNPLMSGRHVCMRCRLWFSFTLFKHRWFIKDITYLDCLPYYLNFQKVKFLFSLLLLSNNNFGCMQNQLLKWKIIDMGHIKLPCSIFMTGINNLLSNEALSLHLKSYFSLFECR